MAIFLFVQPSEIAESTLIGGNVDIDKYAYTIELVQISVIEPLLGTELYDKIVTEATAATLTGDYLTLYEEYVQKITKYQATAEILDTLSYVVDNSGIIKNTPANAEVVSKEEVQFLSQKYSGIAQMYAQRFKKWICKNPLDEYKTVQDEVNAQRHMKLTGGWYFGNQNGISEDELGFTDNTNDYLELE
ncbi:MAG TPA: hypothetical protein VJ945_03455 [Flavobacteriaceae bacterium]|nr:hypothetical protein [Flavobacteriaceae bacterium]